MKQYRLGVTARHAIIVLAIAACDSATMSPEPGETTSSTEPVNGWIVLNSSAGNSIGSPVSYQGAAAARAYRRALDTAFEEAATDDRRADLRARVAMMSPDRGSGAAAALEEGCEGSEVCDDPDILITEARTTVSLSQATAYVKGQGFLLGSNVCNDMTVHLVDSHNVSQCEDQSYNVELTTEVLLSVNDCPDSQEIRASTTHKIGLESAVSNDRAPCEERTSQSNVPGGSLGQETEWCLVEHTYINNVYSHTRIIFCWD